MTYIRAYWRIPFWLRITVVFCVTVGAGLLIDGLTRSIHQTANLTYLAAVLVIWGLIAAAEKRHRSGR
jgi:hypothetical protein